MKDFINEEDGMGTIEIVIIIAVLVGVALIFKDSVFAYVKDLIGTYFKNEDVSPGETNVYHK